MSPLWYGFPSTTLDCRAPMPAPIANTICHPPKVSFLTVFTFFSFFLIYCFSFASLLNTFPFSYKLGFRFHGVAGLFAGSRLCQCECCDVWNLPCQWFSKFRTTSSHSSRTNLSWFSWAENQLPFLYFHSYVPPIPRYGFSVPAQSTSSATIDLTEDSPKRGPQESIIDHSKSIKKKRVPWKKPKIVKLDDAKRMWSY